jgi:hypothetical protein
MCFDRRRNQIQRAKVNPEASGQKALKAQHLLQFRSIHNLLRRNLNAEGAKDAQRDAQT